MLDNLNPSIGSQLRRVLSPGRIAYIAFFGSLFAVVVLGGVFAVTTAIRAMYGVIGTVFAVLTLGYQFTPKEFSFSPRDLCKFVVSIALIGVSLAFLSDIRLVVFPFLFLGYLALGLYLVTPDLPRWPILPLTVVLFVALTLSKYLTTGFYFGGGDILGHVRSTEQLLSGGIEAITYTSYSSFPGLHIATGFVSLVSELPVYDSMILLGITAMSAAVVAVYLLFSLQFSNLTLAATATIVFSTFPHTVYYTTYVYPQTIAFALAIFMIFIAHSAIVSNHDSNRRLLLGGIVVVAMAVTHHFTALLLLPAVLLIIAVDLYRRNSTDTYFRLSRHSVLFTFWIATLAFYWTVIDDWIFSATLYALNRAVLAGGIGAILGSSSSNSSSSSSGAKDMSGTTTPMSSPGQGETPTTPVSSPGQGETPTTPVNPNGTGGSSSSSADAISITTLNGDYGFDVELWGDTIQRSMSALLGPDLIHQATLVCFAVLAIIAIIQNGKKIRFTALFYLSLMGAPLLFETPLHFKSINRIQMVWVLFFAGFIGMGIGRPILDEGLKIRKPVLAGVIVLSVVAGGLAAADDIATVHPSEQRPREVELDNEYPMFRQLSSFSGTYLPNLSTFWISGAALERFGVSTSSLAISKRGISSDTQLLVTRSEWLKQRAKVENENSVYFPNVYFSERALNSMWQSENQVYTTGSIRVLYAEDRIFSPQSTTNAST